MSQAEATRRRLVFHPLKGAGLPLAPAEASSLLAPSQAAAVLGESHTSSHHPLPPLPYYCYLWKCEHSHVMIFFARSLRLKENKVNK